MRRLRDRVGSPITAAEKPDQNPRVKDHSGGNRRTTFPYRQHIRRDVAEVFAIFPQSEAFAALRRGNEESYLRAAIQHRYVLAPLDALRTSFIR